RFAWRFAPPEYFALMILGLAMVVFLAGESMVKALLAMLVGLWIATIGTDLFTAESRFTFGQTKLLGGVDLIAATVGIFAIGEVLVNLESQGVAAPEGANNADAGGALVPLLTLGIPGGNTTAILLGGLILWGYRPGPLLIQEHPELFWGLVASMYIGNVLLLVLNLPLVPLFAQILRLPYYVLYPLIVGISIVGVYSVNNSLFDVWMMGFFGLLGYLMRKLDFPAAALILGMVLGDGLERALRQSLMMSQGDILILATRPISGSLLLIAATILCLPAIRKVRFWRVAAVEREG